MAISLSTEDKLEYQFYPVSRGQIQFRVKAPNDAHIALTSGPSESDPMFEVFIGGWSNAKSVIRKNRTRPDVIEVDTPGILSSDEFRGFCIRWENGVLTVSKEGDPDNFMSYSDPDVHGIGYFGVCTGWGASGEWLLEGYNFKTADELTYRFFSIPGASVAIEVKAKSNAHIALTQGNRESTPMYEIMLGGWENTQSNIRYDRTEPDKVRVNTPSILSPDEHRRFLISWWLGHITVQMGDHRGPVIAEWKDPNPIGISHVGIRTGWGATGNWKIHFLQHPTAALKHRQPQDHSPSAPPVQPTHRAAGGSLFWADSAGGQVPPDAVKAGFDGEELYVGRAHHEGALIPGKIVCSHGVCYVPWGGGEHGKSDYQVLCGGNATWVPVQGGNIPPTAVPSGECEDGEPLFVGRVQHEGTTTPGKVQASHGVLYIPYGGAEVSFPEYEVLVVEE